ncbi:hypothetical protein Q5P01_002333 [Channa striata]|uniref:Transmembrane protein 179B n=1 Tax=Channa striata TaxID=64152 RepID=A0AA88NQV5_CHASR|nr:hypothetical protein Q5P01_002333 [Channa striata]
MASTGLLLLELGLYASSFVCGIVAAASITIAQGDFGGLCMLYGLVKYNESSGLIGVQSSSSASLCYFVSAISVMVAVVCFSVSLFWLYNYCVEGVVRRERMCMNLIVAVCGVFLFFLLVTGCMLKIGRDTLCTSVMSSITNVTRCEEAQSKKWASPLKGEWFYNRLHRAETAVWVNFFFWLIIGVLVIIQRRQVAGTKVIVGGPVGTCEGQSAGESTLENTEDRLKLESQKQSTKLVIKLSLESMNMSRDQCESVAVSVESLLNDAKRMQMQCRERSEQLSRAATQLRVESAALRQQCETAQLDMARLRRYLDELMETKSAFEARERQARKLSKQL